MSKKETKTTSTTAKAEKIRNATVIMEELQKKLGSGAVSKHRLATMLSLCQTATDACDKEKKKKEAQREKMTEQRKLAEMLATFIGGTCCSRHGMG